MEQVILITASEAHRRMILAGFKISYPTVVKRLTQAGIASQPAPKSSVLVDSEKLKIWMKENRPEVKSDGN